RRQADPLTAERCRLARAERGSGWFVREAVGVVDARADAHGCRGALERGVVHALRPLTGADMRDDLVEAALRAERDEGGALGVAHGPSDRHGGGVATRVVVVRA